MNRRQSFRLWIAPERSEALIQSTGKILSPGKNCSAILLDESTGGFRVQFKNADLDCELNQEFCLQTYSGRHAVQVIRKVSLEENCEVGFARLFDETQQEARQIPLSSHCTYYRPGVGGVRGVVLIGVSVILLVPITLYILRNLFSHSELSHADAQEETENVDYPTLAGRGGAFFETGLPQVSRSGPRTSGSRGNSTSEGISKVGNRLIGGGVQGAKHILQGTVHLVHSILTGLPAAQRGRLEEVVDDYSESPSSGNLKRVENLLGQPEFQPLQNLVKSGTVSSVELASLLFTEFHSF